MNQKKSYNRDLDEYAEGFERGRQYEADARLSLIGIAFVLGAFVGAVVVALV
jgi:hypothetical protein